MPSPRHIRFTARLAAAWFVLALAAAVAAPWVQLQAATLVCSASGTSRLLVQTGDGWRDWPGHSTLNCPLCLLAGGGPPRAVVEAAGSDPPREQAASGELTPWFHPIHEAGAPLPARGPPRRS